MLLTKAIEKVKNSKEFKEVDDKDHFLAHAFCTIDNIQSEWQIGFHNKKTDKVTVFTVDKEVTKNPEEEVFKKPDHTVKPLNIDKLKIDLEKAIEIADKLVEEKYKGEIVNKKICIVQHLEKDMYNLTLVTAALNIINVKIDSTNGDIIHESRQSIMGLKKE